MKDSEIIPITLKTANEYVTAYHRHHKAVIGCKFCVGLQSGDKLIGVAICGRPADRYHDDGKTLEIDRLCTVGSKNDCSRLYGACVRIAREMGYKKVITYALESENGAGLKASNFVRENRVGGKKWTGKQCRDNGVPEEFKTRWVKYL